MRKPTPRTTTASALPLRRRTQTAPSRRVVPNGVVFERWVRSCGRAELTLLRLHAARTLRWDSTPHAPERRVVRRSCRVQSGARAAYWGQRGVTGAGGTLSGTHASHPLAEPFKRHYDLGVPLMWAKPLAGAGRVVPLLDREPAPAQYRLGSAGDCEARARLRPDEARRPETRVSLPVEAPRPDLAGRRPPHRRCH